MPQPSDSHYTAVSRAHHRLRQSYDGCNNGRIIPPPRAQQQSTSLRSDGFHHHHHHSIMTRSQVLTARPSNIDIITDDWVLYESCSLPDDDIPVARYEMLIAPLLDDGDLFDGSTTNHHVSAATTTASATSHSNNDPHHHHYYNTVVLSATTGNSTIAAQTAQERRRREEGWNDLGLESFTSLSIHANTGNHQYSATGGSYSQSNNIRSITSPYYLGMAAATAGRRGGNGGLMGMYAASTTATTEMDRRVTGTTSSTTMDSRGEEVSDAPI
jgi:hypothetical protein